MSKLATLALTAALAAAFTLFGCKEEKAKTPEADAAAAAITEAEAKAEAPAPAQIDISTLGKTPDEILAKVDLIVRFHSSYVSIETVRDGKRTGEDIEGLVLKVDGNTIDLEKSGNGWYSPPLDSKKFSLTRGATYDFEITAAKPKKNAKVKITLPLDDLDIQYTEVSKKTYEITWKATPSDFKQLSIYNAFEKYVDASSIKYTIARDEYKEDEFSLDVNTINLAVADKVLFWAWGGGGVSIDTQTLEDKGGVTLKLDGIWGFSNEAANKILVQSQVKNPKDYNIVIGNLSRIAPVKFSHKQERNEAEDSGRDTYYNFDNLAGNIFEVTAERFMGGTGFLVNKDVDILLIEFIDEETGVDAEHIERIEKLKNRKITQKHCIAETTTGAKVYELTFARKGKDVLGSLAYVEGDKMIFLDFPAEYDEISTWRVDDNGEFGGLHVFFLAHTSQGLIIGIKWDGPEGESSWVSVEKDGNFVKTQFSYSRYWSPM